MGMSRSLAGVLFARSLGTHLFCSFLGRSPLTGPNPAAGFFSGNVAVVHSIIGEITDSSNQAIAFPIYGLCWPLGAIIGYVAHYLLCVSMSALNVLLDFRPLLGGTFSNPAEKYPQFFDIELFRAYPYLLPSLIAASVAAFGAIFGFFFLEEVGG